MLTDDFESWIRSQYRRNDSLRLEVYHDVELFGIVQAPLIG